ncbi:MAG: hypothetical protein P8O70_15730 [SAR324 cluster bacterium]|nr:hypothetical protein [SAR324 cluster bacterium]
MSVIHCQLQNSLHKTDSLSLNPSGALPKLLLRTQQMRAIAQNLADRDSSNTNKKLMNALDLIDRTAGPKTIVINPSTLGSKVMQQSLEGNIDHVKIAAENHSAAFSTPLDLGLLTMKKLIDDSLQTVQ